MKKKAIYGVGVYGRRVLDCFKILNEDISFFIVSQKSKEMPSSIDGISIYDVTEISVAEFEKLIVIVAVNENYHKDIKRTLVDKYGNCVNDNVVFYKKSDIDTLFRKAHPIDLGNIFLHSLQPVSRLFGNDRGTPVDRYYIEKYLEKESKLLPLYGKTLEVGEDTYSRYFFPKYKHEVLDYSKGMDLTRKDTLHKAEYDVFICTQVFHQIYDVKSAIEGAYYLLKNDGVMLATVCGNITKLARNDEYEHYWCFTKLSIEALVKEVFGEEVAVVTYGNCMVATAFIEGVALEEIDKSLLDINDLDYTICISITAKKGGTK